MATTAAELVAGQAHTSAPAAGYPPARTAWYATCVLAGAICFAQLDLAVVGLLVQPIKKDLVLTDVQVSLLMGFSFSIFYTFIGLPVARLTDKGQRNIILAVGVATWSLATAFCGIAQNFWQFFCGRVMVGAGESVNGPAAYSMLSDYFPSEKLPRAFSVLWIGGIIGGGISTLLNAFLIYKLQGLPPFEVPVIGIIRWWQVIFIAVGLPGLIVAFLLSRLPEPPRHGLDTGMPRNVPLFDVARYIFRDKLAVFGPLLGSQVIGAFGFGGAMWMAAFYQRSYGWSLPQVALLSGLSQTVTMLAGLWFGVKLSEYLAKRGHADAYLKVVVWVRLLGLPASLVAPLMPNGWLALGFGSVAFLVVAASGAPLNAAMQIVTPNQMRGQINALYSFIYSVVATGMGTTVIAMITQYWFRDEGQLRYAILTNSLLFGPLSIAVMWFGVKPYGREVARLEALRRERM